MESPIVSRENRSESERGAPVPGAPSPAVGRQPSPAPWPWSLLVATEPLWLAPALLVLIIAPSALVPPWLERAAAYFLIIPWAVRLLAAGRLTRRTPLDWPLLAFFATMWVGWVATVDAALSWHIFKANLIGLAIYYAIVNSVETPRRLQAATALLMALGASLTMLTVIGTRWTTTKLGPLGGIYEMLPRLDVTALNPLGFGPNTAAGMLVIFLPIGLALLVGARGWAWRIATLFLTLLLTMGLLLAQSRGALVGAVAAVALVLVARSRPLRLVALPAALVGLVVLIRQGDLATLLEIAIPGEATSSFLSRSELWGRAVYMIQDFPFTGIGMGTFQIVVNLLYPLFTTSGRGIPHAHQTFLQMAVDFGIPGFVAWGGALVAWFVLVARTARHAPTAWQRALALGLVAALVAVLVHGLLDAAVIYSTKGMAVLWFVLGLGMALWQQASPAGRARG